MNDLVIVAEIGSNWCHVNQPELSRGCAIQAIKEAADAGATVAKFQLFDNHLYSKKRAPKQYEAMLPYQLPIDWLPALRNTARACNVQLWASVFSVDLIPLAVLYCDCLKIASGDIDNEPLIRAVARACEDNQRAMAISTGAAFGWEVESAMGWIKEYDIPDLTLFACVSTYPAMPMEYNLRAILPWMDIVDAIGLSDHTLDIAVAQIAIGAGYSVIEKHFAPLDCDRSNPDAGHSLPPKMFKEYVRALTTARCILGNYTKQPKPSELGERIWARRGKDGLRPREEV